MAQVIPSGRFVVSTTSGEKVRAFVPDPLPPASLAMDSLFPLLDQANQALGRLDGLTTALPDAHLLLYTYVRKEAVVSSQIEGTQSTLSDLLLFETNALPGVPLDDVAEVSSYVAAMEHGLERLRTGFPLSLRLIREVHAILLQGSRGAHQGPGEFRRSQNWIGGTRPGNALFVPPPPEYLMFCVEALDWFLHGDGLPLLVRIALLHVQFETIHPFLDGNGRLGRLLVTLLLCERGVLRAPLLYLSLYLKTHRNRYYELLQDVRLNGAWQEWVRFFLEAVRDTAGEAAETVRGLEALVVQDRATIQTFGRRAGSALRVHTLLQKQPLIEIAQAASTLGLSFPAVSAALRHLAAAGIVHEITGQRRGRLFAYQRYLELLSAGTEPLPRREV